MWLIVLMSFVVTCMVTFCQRITLQKPQYQSTCESSLIGNVDRFRIVGVIAGNVASYLASGWEETLNIGVSSKFSEEWNLCELSVATASCHPDPVSQCFCSEVSSDTGAVSFVIDYIAGVALSENTIRAKWKYNATVRVYSNNHTLPKMFDDTAAELVLDVRGTTEESLTESGTCSYSLTLNNSIHLTVCCNSPFTPCYPRIKFKDDEVTNKSCVSYPTSELTSSEVTGEVVLTYSVCNSTREIVADTCSKASKTSTTRATTLSVTTTMTKRTTTLIKTTVTRPTTTRTTALSTRSSTAESSRTTTTTLGSSTETEEPKLAAVVALAGSQRGNENFILYLVPGLLIAAVGFTFFTIYGFFPEVYKTNCRRARYPSGSARGSAAKPPGVGDFVEQAADFDADIGTEV